MGCYVHVLDVEHIVVGVHVALVDYTVEVSVGVDATVMA